MKYDKQASDRSISNLVNISRILKRICLVRLMAFLLTCMILSKVVIQQCSSVWISQLLLIPFHTKFFSKDWNHILECSSWLCTVSLHISQGGRCQWKWEMNFFNCVLHLGFPQGSVLELVLFLLYESPIARVLAQYAVRHHVCADDLNIVSAFTLTLIQG